MKKIVLYIIFLFGFLFTNCQNNYFNKRYDINNQADISRGIVEVEGGYLVAGGSDYGIITLFIDTLGNKKWYKEYHFDGWAESYFGYAGALIKTKGNNIAIAGQLKADTNYTESLLMKINISGDTLWTKSYRINYPYYYSGASQCKQTFDNGIIITGIYDCLSTTNSGADFLLIKTDSNGIIQWWKNYGDNKSEMAYNVIQTPDKGYLLGGMHYYGSGGYLYVDPKIVKTDSLGNFKWDKLLGGPFNDDPAMVCIAKDSNYIVAYTEAEYEISGDAYRKIKINKLDTSSNVIWSRKYGPVYYNNNLAQIKLMQDGGFLVCGFTNHPQFDFYQVGWMLRLNADGDSIWYREYANSVQNNFFNELHDFYITKEHGIVATGPLYPSTTGGTQDIWIIKTDSIGCLFSDCTCVGTTEFNSIAGVQMLIYPNPFNNAFAINYHIPKESNKAVFMLYDIYGKLIFQTCLNKELNQLQMVASVLKPGVYIAKLMLDNVMVYSEKIIKE